MKSTPFALALVLIASSFIGFAKPTPTSAYVAKQRQNFPVILPGERILSGIPTLADLDGQGQLDIIVGGHDGIVYAVRSNGSLRWSFNVSTAINNAARNVRGLRSTNNSIPFRTAPAVADINNDGQPEIIITAGDIFDTPAHGGIVALDKNGRLLPGWPRLSMDVDSAAGTGADGYTDGIASSPAVGDINGDGQPDIVYGAFDQRVYARRADGSLLPGWPRFVLDTVWSSPAIADINGDGKLDVVIGVDAHDYNGDEGSTLDGGDLYVFNGDGSLQWRQHQDEIFESSPAVADVNGDGRLEIFTGTGTYYGNRDKSQVGRYFTAWNSNGSIRWRTALPDRVIGSPAIGDINGDGQLEVVVGVTNGEVFAFNGNTGAVLWHTLARDIFNNKYLPDPLVTTPVLGDYDGDSVDDVFIALGWDVIVMKGANGQQLTATSNLDPNKPSFYGSYTIPVPAVGDIDNNGTLDIVSASGTSPGSEPGRAQINSWEVPNSTAKASWPMFRGNPEHTGLYERSINKLSVDQIPAILKNGTTNSYTIAFSPDWTVKENDPNNIVSLKRSSDGQNDFLIVTLNAPRTTGTYTASLIISSPDAPDVTIPITLRSVQSVTKIATPLVIR